MTSVAFLKSLFLSQFYQQIGANDKGRMTILENE